MNKKFRIGITLDAITANGTVFGEEAMKTLDDPAVEWEFLAEKVPELTRAHGENYDALCVMSARVTPATLSSPKRNVKLIARFGVGYDSVDVPACTENGVMLTITPDGVRRPVAASVIGVGNIGKEIFRLAQPFGMRLLGCDPNVPQSAVASLNVTMVDKDKLLREADFISVNTLLDEKTKGLIGARDFALMKPGAYFINTARGPVVVESALIDALRNNRIAGAAIDVFENEPVAAANPLLKLDNVILAPHAICHTDECMSLLGQGAFKAAVDLAHGRKPHLIVNTEVLKHPAWVGKFHA